MFLLQPNAKVRDTEVYFDVVVGGVPSAVDSFEIMAPFDFGTQVNGGSLLGASRTKRNTMVVDSMTLENGTFTIPQTDPDPSTPGNQAYLPFRILSLGPIRLINANISANGANGATGTSGGNGGPGGGGGGSGYPGSGGAGYTGGGGENDGSSGPGGMGTGSVTGSSSWVGGQSLNGVTGGDGEQHSGSGGDDGGGGGTGLPFGTSGAHGTNTPNALGGYGGGSAGGSNSTYTSNYGGGGGGNLANGSTGQGNNNNGGQTNGNPMLIPLAGGSGGGAGNVTYNTLFGGGAKGGAGGGGGGVVELTSFADLDFTDGIISAEGGSGGSAVPETFEAAAGGGGGSGGAMSLGARDSVVIRSGEIRVTGGSGGSSSNSNSNGGSGSPGRVRFNGFVSKYSSPNSSNYFVDTAGFTGPSIQRVTSTPDSVYVHGYAESWDGFPSAGPPIAVYYSWPSSRVWRSTLTAPRADPKSHTYQWDAVVPNSTNSVDTEVYVVAVQSNTYSPSTYTDSPPEVMSHTGGIISPVVGQPKMAVNDTAIDFGNVLVDSCSSDTTIEIYSTGRGPLIVDSVVLVPPIPDYHIKTSFPYTIASGDSLALILSFCPTKVQCPISAQLYIYSNVVTPVPTAKVALTGCGIQPHVLIRPLVLYFGRIHIGDCKDTFAEVIDTGSSPLTISRESLGDLTHFKIFDALPITVPAHDSDSIHLEFCPSDTTTVTTIDTIVSNAPESPNLLTLIGSGKIGVLTLPAVFNFGLVHLGDCKDSGFYIVNDGNDSLIVTSAVIPPGNFTLLSPQVPFVLGAGDSIFDTIEYCADTGMAISSITTGTDVPDSGTVILLAHTGIGILSIPDTINFGAVPSGSCIDTNIFVKNMGSDTLFLDTAAMLFAPFYYLGPAPLILAPGASDSVMFRFCSTDTGLQEETTAFDTIRAGISPRFTLLGRGTQGALATSGAIDVGCIALGSDTIVKVTIRNTGTASLDSLSASIIPVSLAIILHPPPDTLAAGANDSVVLTIPASSFGPILGTLSIVWSGGTPVTLPITGNVTTPPKITALDTFVAFDTTNIGDSSVDSCIRLTNYSCIPISVGAAVIAGALPGEFEIVSNSTPTSLSDGTIGMICIRYKPQRIGLDTAKLELRSGNDTVSIATLSGVGKGSAIGVELAVDTVAGRPGQIVNVPVRTLNDITPAAIATVTFRVTFDPMQLDLKKPIAPATLWIEPATPLSTTASYSVHKYSIGDQEITASYSAPLTGTPAIAELPFEILEPTENTARVHLVSATFGTSPAALSTESDGEIQIEQCDTNDRVALSIAPIAVSQNVPNPFSARTSISVNVNFAGHLTIELYNALGLKVLVPFDGDVPVGTQTIPIDAAELPSGAYRYITTWTGTGQTTYQPQTARDEKTMIVLGE